ncbi:hypothetical protein Taro_044314, partial [Colocasia esculenta]|nr:hypothetical protein [Colocasia esculenta]
FRKPIHPPSRLACCRTKRANKWYQREDSLGASGTKDAQGTDYAEFFITYYERRKYNAESKTKVSYSRSESLLTISSEEVEMSAPVNDNKVCRQLKILGTRDPAVKFLSVQNTD